MFLSPKFMDFCSAKPIFSFDFKSKISNDMMIIVYFLTYISDYKQIKIVRPQKLKKS